MNWPSYGGSYTRPSTYELPQSASVIHDSKPCSNHSHTKGTFWMISFFLLHNHPCPHYEALHYWITSRRYAYPSCPVLDWIPLDVVHPKDFPVHRQLVYTDQTPAGGVLHSSGGTQTRPTEIIGEKREGPRVSHYIYWHKFDIYTENRLYHKLVRYLKHMK